MNKRNFLTAVGGVSALTAINSMEKAEALEYAMNAELDTILERPRCVLLWAVSLLKANWVEHMYFRHL